MILLFLLCCTVGTFYASESKEEAALTPANGLFDRVIYENVNGKEVQRATSNRAALIFIDNDEYEDKGSKAITKVAALAIFEEDCPVIMSSALLLNMMRLAEIADGFQSFFVRVLSMLESEKFIMGKIKDSSMLFLIPTSYLKKLDISDSPGSEALKLKLGLHISDVFTEKPDVKTLTAYHEEFKKRSMVYTIKAITDLFVINKLYYREENKKYAIPQWSIYISGHGTSGKMVVGMGILVFEGLLLDFLDNKITTKLFVTTNLPQ